MKGSVADNIDHTAPRRRSHEPPHKMESTQPGNTAELDRGEYGQRTDIRKESQQCIYKEPPILYLTGDLYQRIASFSSPVSLLVLAYTCKSLFRLLTHSSRDAENIWANAERAIGMPKCPPDLTPFAYAQLVFSKTCLACGAQSEIQNFRHRINLCENCAATALAKQHCIQTVGAVDIDRLSDPLACLVVYGESTLSYSDFSKLTEKSFRNGAFIKCYRTPRIQSVLRDFFDLPRKDLKARKTFIEYRRQYVRALKSHADKMDNWAADRQTGYKKRVLADLMRRGFPANRLYDIQAPNYRGEYTDQGWEEVIRIQAKPIEENMRKEKLFRRFLSFQMALQTAESSAPPCVNRIDFLELDEVKDAVADETLGSDIPAAVWERIRSALSELHEERWCSIKAELEAQVSAARREAGFLAENDGGHEVSRTDEQSNTLLLATTLFERGEGKEWSLQSYNDIFASVLNVRANRTWAWNSKRYSVSPHVMKVAGKLLEEFGMCRDTPLAALRGARFACLECVEALPLRMSWEELVKHYVLTYTTAHRSALDSWGI